MKNLKKIILFIFFIFIFLVIVLFFVKNNISHKDIVSDSGSGSYAEKNENVYRVKNNSTYFTAESLIQLIFYNIYELNEDYINDTLNKTYKNESNIIEELYKTDGKKSIYNIEMYEKDDENSINIFTKNKLIINEKCDNNNLIFIVLRLDIENSTYDFYFIEEDTYNSIVNNEKKIEKCDIAVNNNNKFVIQNLDERMIASKYFNNYKNLLLYDYERAYELLDENYKKHKFSNIENFEEFIEQNRNRIEKFYLNNYVENFEEDKKVYICSDRGNNYFIFKIDTVMNYTVQLDSYTERIDYFKNQYESLKEEEKAALNIQKTIEMINNKDYESVYYVLASSFKENYYITQAKCNEIINKLFYNINIIESVDVEKQGNYYIVKCEIVNEEDYNESRKINFVVKLKDNFNFEMSFLMNK